MRKRSALPISESQVVCNACFRPQAVVMQLVDLWIMKRLGPPSAKGYEKSCLYSLLHPYRG